MSIQSWWTDRTFSERAAFSVGGLLFVAALVGSAMWAFRPNYEVLFGDLEPDDARSIANQLTADGIEFRLEQDSGQILVPASEMHAARLKVMERDLPLRRPVGFELFDEAEFGMTDFTQRINYQRALEGELTRTITALEEVSRARLHLVLPEQGLFKRNEEAPKASLTLIVKPGRRLTSQQIKGIQRLVAASVAGMSPDQVAIHDQQGVSLADTTADSTVSAGLVTERLGAKREVEAYLSQKLQAALSASFPDGQASAVVDVELDMDRRRVTRDESVAGREPSGARRGVDVSMSQKLESNATSDDRSGAPSPRPRLSTTLDSMSLTNGRVTETIDVSPGAIQRISVGVLIPHGWNQDEQQRLVELVRNAVGMQSSRGDTISILQLPTAGTHSAEDVVHVPATSPDERLPTAVSWSLPLLIASGSAALLFLGFGGYWLGRRQGRPNLSDVERQRLLAEVEQWLRDGASDGALGAVR